MNRPPDGSHDDELSRVTSMKDGTLRLAVFDYKGVAEVVGVTYPEPNVASVVYGATAGTYPHLDAFGRITSSRWTKQLGTPRDFYRVDLTYDRNSNLTVAKDLVHAGMDVVYTNDALNRLAAADEGTESGGSISSRTRKQEWTLSHTGNWDREKLDLDGNGSWGGTNEHDDTRTHTVANAISTRDLDSTSGTTGNNYTLTHDLVGNLTDDGQSYKYEWDPFGRLRKVKNQSNTLVAEYRYNGLGFRIAWHEDTDASGGVDSSDKWYYPMYDEAWRMLAVFRESDTAPKEEWVPQLAGLGGFGGSSALDAVICRYKDANNAWTAASDGTLEERRYLCQNWRGDVSAVVDSSGGMNEWAKYLSYGTPFGLPAGDTDSDGDCDGTDIAQIQTWINNATYDVRGDLDLDGDVDSTDKSIAQATYRGTTLGFNALSAVANRRGYAGYELDWALPGTWHVRHRVLDSALGRWLSRDQAGPVDGPGLHEYVRSRPSYALDPRGLQGIGLPPLPPTLMAPFECGDTGTHNAPVAAYAYGLGCANCYATCAKALHSVAQLSSDLATCAKCPQLFETPSNCAVSSKSFRRVIGSFSETGCNLIPALTARARAFCTCEEIVAFTVTCGGCPTLVRHAKTLPF